MHLQLLTYNMSSLLNSYRELLPFCSLGAGGYEIDWQKASSVISADRICTLKKQMKEDLTVQPPGFNDKKPPPWFMCVEQPRTWFIPRYWAEQHIGCPEQILFSPSTKPHLTDAFTGTPRPNQADACRFLEGLLSQNKLVLARFNLYTSWGKTFFAMMAAKLLGTRMLIVSHKTVLLDQYLGEIEKFFASNTVKVGFLNGKKKCNLNDETYDVVLATVQSILRLSAPVNSFGLVIIDEVHHYGSQTFSRVGYTVNAPVMIGLSADKERSDGLDYVIDAHFGPYIYTEDPDIDQVCKLDVHAYRCHLKPKVKQAAYKKDVGWMEKMNAMCLSEERNDLIIKAVMHFMQTDAHAAQRHILLLCKNKDQVDYIHSGLVTALDDTLRIIQWTGDRKNRKMTHADAAGAHVIVATYGMLGEGVSLDFLDTLVICSQNKMNMNQAFGRILRRLFAFPYVVIDFDDVDFFPGMFRHRLKQYKERLPGADCRVRRWKSSADQSGFTQDTFSVPVEIKDTEDTPSDSPFPVVYKRRRDQ